MGISLERIKFPIIRAASLRGEQSELFTDPVDKKSKGHKFYTPDLINKSLTRVGSCQV
jgi:hypothetical protein